MKRREKLFEHFCERTGLNPASVLPAFKVPKGIYQLGTTMNINSGRSKPKYMEFSNGYELLWSWCHHKNDHKAGEPESFWEWFWGFLFECSVGVYTPDKYWVSVE